MEVLSEERLRLRCTCKERFCEHSENNKSFLDLLKSWGGEWLWRGLNLNEDPSWAAECLANNTLVCVTDGSYQKELAPDLCSAGWILWCRQSGKCISGTLVEKSTYASSYRGELLGLLAIRLFLLAVEEYYGVTTDGSGLVCDNKAALYTFGKESKRIPSGQANTDIQRVLRTIKARSKSTYEHQHVAAHQDEYTKYEHLELEAKLNCLCDTKAKEAIENYVNGEGVYEGISANLESHTLSLEAARVFVNGIKQTTDIRKGLKRDIGRTQAREFYKRANLLPEKVFEVVDWEAIELTLKNKPKMYNLWYGKQCSGWCGTNKKLKQWGQTDDSRCPNCRGFNEDAAHLMVCPCENRTKFFQEHVEKLSEWMDSHHTDPELAPLITRYLLGRGKVRFIRLPGLPSYFEGLARTQDAIGWRNFTEGKLSKTFRRVQDFLEIGVVTVTPCPSLL